MEVQHFLINLPSLNYVVLTMLLSITIRLEVIFNEYTDLFYNPFQFWLLFFDVFVQLQNKRLFFLLLLLEERLLLQECIKIFFHALQVHLNSSFSL